MNNKETDSIPESWIIDSETGYPKKGFALISLIVAIKDCQLKQQAFNEYEEMNNKEYGHISVKTSIENFDPSLLTLAQIEAFNHLLLVGTGKKKNNGKITTAKRFELLKRSIGKKAIEQTLKEGKDN